MTATPDGNTLMFSNSSSHSIASLGSTAVKYDPVKDLEPVGAVARTHSRLSCCRPYRTALLKNL